MEFITLEEEAEVVGVVTGKVGVEVDIIMIWTGIVARADIARIRVGIVRVRVGMVRAVVKKADMRGAGVGEASVGKARMRRAGIRTVGMRKAGIVLVRAGVDDSKTGIRSQLAQISLTKLR